MAATRSALAMLSRRCCGSSRSSAAASMNGIRGPEIHQLPRPVAVRNLHQSWRNMSTGGREFPVKSENAMRAWWQRVRNRVENANAEERTRALFVYGLFTMGTASLYAVKTAVDIYLLYDVQEVGMKRY